MNEQIQKLTTPVAVIVAGIIIAGAIIFTDSGNNEEGNRAQKEPERVRATQENDHVYGNPDAEISLIEYSDFECPYCQRVHPTLKEIVDESDGEINWVYRHFPLSNAHPSAVGTAVASECVADLAGNEAFWTFADRAFNNQHNLKQPFFVSVATDLGIAEADFRECYDNANTNGVLEEIQTDLREVTQAGGNGTPYTVIKTEDGAEFPAPGALPKAQFLQVIERAKTS